MAVMQGGVRGLNKNMKVRERCVAARAKVMQQRRWRNLAVPVTAVAMPSTKPPTSHRAKRSKVEIIKQESDFLRHPLMEELVTPAMNINEASMQLMKFHGSYQQDNRDMRKFGAGKNYSFMMRTKQPSGKVGNLNHITVQKMRSDD